MGPRNFDPMLQQWPTTITVKMNKHLNAEITMDEVSNATIQMGLLKASRPDGLNGQFYQLIRRTLNQGFSKKYRISSGLVFFIQIWILKLL